MRACASKFGSLIFLSATAVLAQTKISPASQIDWALVTGIGVPTGPCTSLNYGQPYTDISIPATPVYYQCTPAGWETVGGSGGSISGQANNVVPLGTASTVIGAQSHLTDAGGVVTSTEPVNVPSPVQNFGILNTPGDSLTAGFEGVNSGGLWPAPDSYPSILQTEIGPVLNTGVGGSTSTQAAVKNGATASAFAMFSGNVPACTVAPCTPISVTFAPGYECTTVSTSYNNLPPVTGTVAGSANIHGTCILQAQMEGLFSGTFTGAWSVSGGVVTLSNLVLISGSTTTFTSGMLVNVSSLTGPTGCSGSLNGPQTLTGGSTTSVSFAVTGCANGSGNLPASGSYVALMYFTPDAGTPGATLTGTPAFTVDNPCPGCNLAIMTGTNNLFANGSYPFGLSVVEGSVAAVAAQTPSNGYLVVMDTFPANVSSQWSSGGSYATFTTYKNDLSALYTTSVSHPNWTFVDTWGALLNGCNLNLPTDVVDHNNGIPCTSERDVVAYGTLTSNLGTTGCPTLTITNGALGGYVTLDAGTTNAENVQVTGYTGGTPGTCVRNYGASAGSAVSHTAGGGWTSSDGTHLNQYGYQIIANAVAAAVRALKSQAVNMTGSGTTVGNFLVTNPFRRGIQAGGNTVMNAYALAGNASNGNQIAFGWPIVSNSIGSQYGSAFDTTFNAYQCGGAGIDLWCQGSSAIASYTMQLTGNGWSLFYAPAGTSPAPFATFFGSSTSNFGHTSGTISQQMVFANSLNTFYNGADATNTILCRAGLTADQRCGYYFYDYLNASRWGLYKESDNSFRLIDFTNNLIRYLATQNGATEINSGAGANVVEINARTNSGTGGLLIYGGGSTPPDQYAFNATGGQFFGDIYLDGLSSATNYFRLTGSPSGHAVVTLPPGGGNLNLSGTQCIHSVSGVLGGTGADCGTGAVTVTITTTNAVSATAGYYYNQDATAAAAITYTLPAPTAGAQLCFKNSNNGSAADTGTLELLVANTGTQSIVLNGTKSSSGYIISSGAAGDAACLVGISTTQWEAYTQVGVWTLH
jgi:hypothetical protein